jgi:hypothetical protein
MTDKFQWTKMRSPNTPLFFLNRLLVLDILITEKSRIRDRFISYLKYSRRGTLFIQKKLGSALTETENWDLLVDCTSRDGRQMLDAGVHLSDKRTLLMKTHIPFQTTVHTILPNPLLLLQMVKKQHILLFLKCFQIYLALYSTARV